MPSARSTAALVVASAALGLRRAVAAARVAVCRVAAAVVAAAVLVAGRRATLGTLTLGDGSGVAWTVGVGIGVAVAAGPRSTMLCTGAGRPGICTCVDRRARQARRR